MAGKPLLSPLTSHRIPESLKLNPYGAAASSTTPTFGSLSSNLEQSRERANLHPSRLGTATHKTRVAMLSSDNLHPSPHNIPFSKRPRDDEELSEQPSFKRPTTRPHHSTSTDPTLFSTLSSSNQCHTPGRSEWQPPTTSSLPSEAPDPDGNVEAIKRYVVATQSCFYHVRGKACPHMDEKKWCPYLHDALPWNSYPRREPLPEDLEKATLIFEQHEHDIAFEEQEHKLSPQEDDDISPSTKKHSSVEDTTDTEPQVRVHSHPDEAHGADRGERQSFSH